MTKVLEEVKEARNNDDVKKEVKRVKFSEPRGPRPEIGIQTISRSSSDQLNQIAEQYMDKAEEKVDLLEQKGEVTEDEILDVLKDLLGSVRWSNLSILAKNLEENIND